jgi:cytochrome c oxidase subunit I+III
MTARPTSPQPERSPRDDGPLDRDPVGLHERLDRAWDNGRGLWSWLTAVDHKSIGKRYIITAMAMFVFGGINAALMRLQLARPDATLIGPDRYNQLFSVHGTTMMFLFAVPVMTAMGLYLVPLMIGARTVPFPRLNAFGYWTYLVGALLLVVSTLLNMAPDAGWFSYVPLSGPQFSPGKRVDVWAQVVTFTEIAGLVAAVQIIVAVLKLRAPGMSINRIPLFVWAQLVVAFMIIFAMPSVATGSFMLAMDRAVNTHFFNPAEGGDALLWQHLFWFFGHPEVYIIFLPALGMISPIVETFCRRPVFGYLPMVVSMVFTGAIAFALWVHHMFAAPGHQMGLSFFTVASMMVSIPTGVQIFCWIATIWQSRPRLTTPMLFVVGFFITFVIGGLTGVMVASVPFDRQAHDSYFIVAHLHYVLLGGAVMPLFGAFYYWFPKFTGRMLSERAGKVHFWLFFVGVNVAFFPMHQLGMEGMPRRVYTYAAASGWGLLNLISTVGAVTIAVSVGVFLFNAWRSRRSGALAESNPWQAPGLEWATLSPPPSYTFLHQPVVESRTPLWEPSVTLPVVTGMHTDRREILVTTTLDARPSYRHHSPSGNVGPLLLAICMGAVFIGSIFTPYAVPCGFGLAMLAGLVWAWPSKKEFRLEHVETPNGTIPLESA